MLLHNYIGYYRYVVKVSRVDRDAFLFPQCLFLKINFNAFRMPFRISNVYFIHHSPVCYVKIWDLLVVRSRKAIDGLSHLFSGSI